MIEQAALGERVVADCDLAWLANYVPDMAAIMSPYLIQKPEEIMAIWNSEVFEDMCTELEAQGLHLIALNWGTRNLLTKKISPPVRMSTGSRSAALPRRCGMLWQKCWAAIRQISP